MKKKKKLSMQERREIVLNCIMDNDDCVRTSDLLQHLPGVSRPLLATDLNWLIEQGKITRVSHGTFTAGRPFHKSSAGFPLLSDSIYWNRASEQTLVKQAIARHIAQNCFNKDGIYGIDAGSTLAMVIQELVNHRPSSSLRIITNNVHGALLVTPASQIDVTLVGGHISYEYAATVGETCDSYAKQLDLSVVGFSRINKTQGVWTFDEPQWEWKRSLLRSTKTIFAGTLDKIGARFDSEPMHSLKKLDYTIVTNAQATAFSAEEIKQVKAACKEFGDRLILVNDQGERVSRISFD